ncbi:hypothetical protein [Listeria seeligeri]|uniref:hypothetical protein n=1 Tax=Listeria seeligeri TaxID=1640 RepID=UPI001886EC42|nr:hypothetical protein [Listeria seeligeri]MBF2663978.1 hypothetical protein [Listeria seeligeri]
MKKKTVRGWEIISSLDARIYEDETGVAILVDMDGFGDQTPVILDFDEDGADVRSFSHLTKKIRISLNRKIFIDWRDEYFGEAVQEMDIVEVERD